MNRKLTILSVLIGAQLVARAAVFDYIAHLDGPSENDPNNSLGIGSSVVTYDDLAHTLRVQASFSGLSGLTTASHIHAPTLVPLTGAAGVATTTPTFAGFPLGVTSGTYDNTLDLTLASSYNPSFLNNAVNGGSTGTAEATLTKAIADGKSYLNIHSTAFPGGEIRGFLTPVPDGGATATLLLGALASGFAFRRFQKS